MFWQDILVDRPFEDRELAATIAVMLAVDPDDVHVTSDIAMLPETMDEQIRVICEVTPVDGDFVMALGIVLRDAALEQWVNERDDRELIGRFCEAGQCAALIADDDANPYSWLLIRGPGDVRPVYLDAQRFDRDEYILAPQHMTAR